MTSSGGESDSLYCPKEVCAAVFIDSQGLAADQHKNSLGCYNFEGSLYDDMYPVYVNQFGQYLIPDEFSNPVMEITRYIVSSSPSGEDGIIRNNKHDDLLCPYDMQDGWEVKDEDTNSWMEDKTITVTCVKS